MPCPIPGDVPSPASRPRARWTGLRSAGFLLVATGASRRVTSMSETTWPASVWRTTTSLVGKGYSRTVWTVSTPMHRPRCMSGTPPNERKRSSPVSGKNLKRGCSSAREVKKLVSRLGDQPRQALGQGHADLAHRLGAKAVGRGEDELARRVVEEVDRAHVEREALGHHLDGRRERGLERRGARDGVGRVLEEKEVKALVARRWCGHSGEIMPCASRAVESRRSSHSRARLLQRQNKPSCPREPGSPGR